jgi:hypothetical protein
MCGPTTWKKVEVRRNSGIAPTLLEQRYSGTALRLRQRTTWMQKYAPEERTEFLSPTSGEHLTACAGFCVCSP